MPGLKLLPIKIPPGMFRNGTNYEAKGRWYDGNMVRWENGRLKPIGGWQALLAPGASFSGVARGGVAWADDSGFKHIMIGTNSNLYVGEGGTFTDITPVGLVAGRVDSILGPGYGAGAYGQENYGTQRTTAGIELDAATWSMDTFGQDWVGCLTSDQKLYEYNVGTGTVAQIANSPTALAVMVTNEDYVLALGAGGAGRKIQWCDEGNDTVWTPATTNSAGSIALNTGGRCRAGARVGLQNIVWTDTDVHLVNYIGTPGIYGPIRIAEGCGLVGPNAFAVTDVAYWWSYGGFFRYNGLVQPMRCDVQDYIFKNVNTLQYAKIYCETNTRFNEVTWWFPSLNSTECDSYVTYDYKQDVWSFGIASGLGARTTWVDRGTFPLPMAVDPSGIIYEHETGFLANGATRVGQVYAQSGPAEIGNGERVVYVNNLIPDDDEDGEDSDNPGTSALQATVTTKFAPKGPATVLGPVDLTPNAEGFVPLMFAGRQAAFKMAATKDEDWSLGVPRVNVVGGGGR